jgi:hypothetical protein
MDKGQSGEETDSVKHAIEYSKIDFPTSLVRCSSTAALDGADRGSPPLHLGQAGSEQEVGEPMPGRH